MDGTDDGSRPGYATIERTSETDASLMFGRDTYRRIDHRCWSPGARLADMDREDVAVQVLSPIPVTFCYRASAAGAAERLLTWTEPVRAELDLEVELPERNGAQRQRALLADGATMQEVYADTVTTTRDTYGQQTSARELKR